MIIEIPEKFYKRKARNKYAEVKNGILEIHGFWSFKRLMVEIAYELKGKHQCYYCKKPLCDLEVTIDHLYPEAYGGISVTNNLVPACKMCNNTKADMNEQEYREWLSMDDKVQRKVFYEKNSLRKNNIVLPLKKLTIFHKNGLDTNGWRLLKTLRGQEQNQEKHI